MRRWLVLAFVCALLGTVAGATPALAGPQHHHTASSGGSVSAAAGNAVINDCQAHGQFTHDWSRADLEKALSMLSAMTNQYSTCNTDIHQALATGIKVRDVTGGSGGGSGTTIVIIVVAVLVVLAALLAGLAIRRRRLGGSGGGGGGAAA